MNDMRKLMEAVQPLFEAHSETLVQIKDKSDATNAELQAQGFRGAADAPVVMTFGPNEEYPAPWRVLKSPEGICQIRAANNNQVVDWLNSEEAEQVMSEIGGEAVTEAMSDEVYDDFIELVEIMNQLHDLSQEAKSIMQRSFPGAFQQADAYGALDFGSSRNQYDTTFDKILRELEADVTDDGEY
jgi:hypothetical protein